MKEYRDMDISELEELAVKNDENKFRGKQIFKWIHRGIEDIDEMTDLSGRFRGLLKEQGYLKNMDIEAKMESHEDGTIKYLMKLKDDNIIECVLMRYSYGNSICISTQAGCSMGCSFCASTIGGKNRNLTSGELVGQILKVQNDTGDKINHVVLMGTGEPLDNFDNVLKFLNIVNNKYGLNISMRHITISTCGLVPEIKKLADLNLQITLAISLHASNDNIRKSIMPIAGKYSFDELLNVCRYYTSVTNRRITFEYALINGVNDDKKQALELAEKIKGMLCHVNLIPVNPVAERNYNKPSRNSVEMFKELLISKGIETTVRRELGSDIEAACGQLRRSYIGKKHKMG